MIGRFRSILFVSVFRGSLAVAIIMIDGSEKPNRRLGFELQSSHVIENRNKPTMYFQHGVLQYSQELIIFQVKLFFFSVILSYCTMLLLCI